LLGISQQDLAEMCSLGVNTIKRLETSDGLSGNTRTQVKIMQALHEAGVVLIDEDDHLGPGVRLRRPERLLARDSRSASRK
jgi:transcriptional regulator with XRE-family HTH domain